MSKKESLTPKQQRFVDEYLVDLNAKQAAIRAGYAKTTAEVQGSRLLSNAKVSAAIHLARQDRSERTQITADEVLQHFWAVATADPNDLVEYRRTCCRYCYGKDFLYQRTPAELTRDREIWEDTPKKERKGQFKEQGGSGYSAKKPPNPECPECSGEGEGRAFFKDTRYLSANAKRLYLGVKLTKGGFEVCMLNPMEALVNVGKHLGMFDSKQAEPPENEEARVERMREMLSEMDRRSAPKGPK